MVNNKVKKRYTGEVLDSIGDGRHRVLCEGELFHANIHYDYIGHFCWHPKFTVPIYLNDHC